MEQLEYSTLPRPPRRPGRLVWAFAGTVAIVIVVCCGGLTIPSSLFYERMNAANVVGKTQAQIISALGPPDPWYSTTEPDGTLIMVYRGPMGDGYRIDLRDGVAVSTMELHK